jgi:hypothetical protein
MAKKDNQNPTEPQAPSPAEQENLKLHGDTQGVEAREVTNEELSPHLRGDVDPTRQFSDDELREMEKAHSEPTVKLQDVPEDDGRRTLASGVETTAAASPDSADYVYRDIVGTSIVGHQEQVPKDEV